VDYVGGYVSAEQKKRRGTPFIFYYFERKREGMISCRIRDKQEEHEEGRKKKTTTYYPKRLEINGIDKGGGLLLALNPH